MEPAGIVQEAFVVRLLENNPANVRRDFVDATKLSFYVQPLRAGETDGAKQVRFGNVERGRFAGGPPEFSKRVGCQQLRRSGCA